MIHSPVAQEIFENMDYGPAPESLDMAMSWIKEQGNDLAHYIGGQFVKGKGQSGVDVIAPATGERLVRIKEASPKEIDQAVETARQAQKDWAALPGFEKKRYLYAIARKIQKNARLFAVLESMDNGKTIRETRDIDIPLAARHFRYHAGWAQLMETRYKDYRPYGVAGQIIPWNFPLLMLAWKIAPALATGNTVILKPAEQTPLTAQLFAQICKDAGLPDGVVNIVHGTGKTGAAIVNHPDIDKIAFTGSTEVGQLIRQATAGTGKGLTLELGGKSPFIVFEDADLDSAVEGVVDAIWFNQGEVCCGGSRLLIQENIYEIFVQKLKNRMKKLRVGGSLDKAMDIGAVVDQSQKKRIEGFISEARETGADICQISDHLPDKGCFIPPTLVCGVQSSDRIVQEEVFGPVATAQSFRTHEEAVKLANNTSYGLAASIWSNSMHKAFEITPQIRAGIIWINGTNMFDASVEFGGYKQSGFGREGGQNGLFAYMKHKSEFDLSDADLSPPDTKFESLAPDLIDQTPKMYIAGAWKRGDSGYNMDVVSSRKVKIGEVGLGNRKDIRNAVEAARKSTGWTTRAGDNRAQIIDFIAENLNRRSEEFASRLEKLTGASSKKSREEVSQAIQALFFFASMADKFEGYVHQPPLQAIVPTLNEAIGIIGICCPNEQPLLSMVTLLGAAISMGNRVVVVPSEKYPLLATDFCQILDTSDVPGGVVNIVTGPRDELAKTLSAHDEVDAMWYHGSKDVSALVEKNAAQSNLKQSWVNCGKAYNWQYMASEGAQELLRRATQVKSIWVPYGEGTGAG